MKFISCRGRGLGDSARYTFEEAVLAGYAADGGMLVPERYPRLLPSTLTAWSALSYAEIVVEVLALYAEEGSMSKAEVVRIVREALSEERFTSGPGEGAVPLRDVRVADLPRDPLTIAELWHGPTAAFKDLGLQVLGRVLSYFLKRSAKRSVLIVGTSGDTGSAAIECVRGLPNIHIIVLYPIGRVSHVQELQMTRRAKEPNVHLIAVEGTSDDLDVPCNEVFGDAAFKTRHGIGSINSINIVRVIVQAAHHIYCAINKAKLAGSEHKPVHIIAPTGAAGNVVSGLWARAMGAPIALIAAVNENDVFANFVQRGVLHVNPRGAAPTNTPSMDIVVPYNVERILHLISGGDCDRTRAWIEEFLSTGHLQLPPRYAARLRGAPDPASTHDPSLVLGLDAFVVTQGEVERTMERVYRASGGTYLLDPHTAVGVAAFEEALRRVSGSGGSASASSFAVAAREGRVVCLACAHVAKFAPTLSAALGISVPDAVALIAKVDGSRYRNVKTVLALQTESSRPAPILFRKAEQKEWGAQLRGIVGALAWPQPQSRL